VRRAVFVEKLSEREAARRFGLSRETVRKMLRYALPPGYQRKQPIKRPKLGPWTGVIDQILEDDRVRQKKQRHTAKRIFERLRAEHAYSGGYTIVKDYVRLRKLSQREMFVPLAHPAGDAQADFGEAQAVIGGVECKAHYLVVDLPQSDDCFVMAFPAETTEAFLEGHNQAFAYFGGVPRTILYDNTKIAVTICSKRSSAAPPRATTKGRSKAWLVMHDATSWCPFRAWPAGMSSMRIFWPNAGSAASASCAAISKPSENVSNKIRRCCCLCRQRPMRLAINTPRA
jgi:transposase